MKLEQLLLTKEELPILDYDNTCCFMIPIYYKLLSTDIPLNPKLANAVFPEVFQPWYEELQKYAEELEKSEKEEDKKKAVWFKDVFLKEKPVLETEFDSQYMGPKKIWEDIVFNLENGFASLLSISRNAGGTLFLPSPNEPDIIGLRYNRFSPEKFKAYNIPGEESRKSLATTFTYHHHNIDYYPGALFLRNWAILYLNEAMKDLDKQGKLFF